VAVQVHHLQGRGHILAATLQAAQLHLAWATVCDILKQFVILLVFLIKK